MRVTLRDGRRYTIRQASVTSDSITGKVDDKPFAAALTDVIVVGQRRFDAATTVWVVAATSFVVLVTAAIVFIVTLPPQT